MQVIVPHTFGAFLAATLVLVPLPWHWKARNVATVAIMAWLFVVNLIYGVNAIVWSQNVNNPAPVYCDISTKIIIGASFALPAATLCVAIHLESVASNRNVRITERDIRRRMIFEAVMCFGIPLLFMALHYIVQGHRYDILEGYGCQAATYFSIPAVFIIWVPPLVFSVGTFVFAGLALRHFIKRRLDFAMHLKSSGSALTTHRYFRLMAMAIVEMTWGTALNIFAIWANVSPGLRVYDSWSDVHSNFSRVGIFFSIFMPPAFMREVELFWWSIPVSAYIFFLFFGLGEEAFKQYKVVFDWFRRSVLRQEVKPTPFTPFPTVRPPMPPPVPMRSSTLDTADIDIKFNASLETLKECPIELPPPAQTANTTDEDEKFTLSTLSYLESPAGRVARALSTHQSRTSIGSQYSNYSFAAGDAGRPLIISPPRPLIRSNTGSRSHHRVPSAQSLNGAFVADLNVIPRSISPIPEDEIQQMYVPLHRVPSSRPTMTVVDDRDRRTSGIKVMVVTETHQMV